MNIYISGFKNFPIYDFGLTSLFGFKLKGVEPKIYENIEEVPLNKNSMVIGCVEDTITFFKNMNWNVNYNLTLPFELNKEKYLKRNVKIIKHKPYQEILDSELINFPFFIKPNNVKEFDATIIRNLGELVKYNEYNDFLISEVVDIVSEYRCYIIDKKIVGCYNYLGDIYQYPNLKLVDEMIKDFKTAPIGYSIDVGILKNGETILIECNDGWSLGNYGLEPKLYTRLLTERWIEILKQN